MHRNPCYIINPGRYFICYFELRQEDLQLPSIKLDKWNVLIKSSLITLHVFSFYAFLLNHFYLKMENFFLEIFHITFSLIFKQYWVPNCDSEVCDALHWNRKKNFRELPLFNKQKILIVCHYPLQPKILSNFPPTTNLLKNKSFLNPPGKREVSTAVGAPRQQKKIKI